MNVSTIVSAYMKAADREMVSRCNGLGDSLFQNSVAHALIQPLSDMILLQCYNRIGRQSRK